jgi:glycosyltransferase involved in cell wall biosynthesis
VCAATNPVVYLLLSVAKNSGRLKVLHHERKRLASHFSIERLFTEIRRHMPADCEVASCPAPEASAGILPRWRNVRHAARQRADVHHIVGDSHYLAFGLPPKKTVLTIHDCGALNRLTCWKRALLKYFWFTGPMRRAAVVTTISEASKEELRKWVGPLADKVVVVPDCVFGDFAYDTKPFNEECPVVLQVGTKWNKNVERVMEAVAGTGCRLEVVGELQKTGHGIFSHSRPEGDSARQSRGQFDASQKKASHGLTRIKGRISPFGCADRTVGECSSPGTPGFHGESSEVGEGGVQEDLKLKTTTGFPVVRELGRLADEELVAAYRRCDMVVFASLYEGFGLPILEAQAMGRPVITSNFGAMREAAGDGALLVDPYSVEEIRAAILRIKNEPGLREELVRKGRENAEKYRAEVVAARYAELYRQVATAEQSETDNSKS